MFIDGAAINKHNTIYTNDNINVTKVHELVSFNNNILSQRNRTHN